MKKIILAVAVLATISTSAVAENNYKPEAMSVATEINYSFDGANTNEGFQLPEYGAKVRLFLNDNWVVRLNLGLGVDTQKGTEYYSEMVSGGSAEYERYNKTTTTTFSIMPGFEYHFNKFDRISPYVGAELGLRTSSVKNVTEDEHAESRTENKTPGLGFAINAVSGVDVYLCKGLYVGAELGLGYEMMNIKRGSSTVESGSGKVETDGSNSTKIGEFGFHVTPTLRVGWHF